MTTEIKLTDREMAIAKGEDPDSVAPSPAEMDDFDGDDSGQEAVTEDAGEPDGAGEPEESWLTDETKDVAQSYGLTDEDLSKFSSEDEFRRHTYLLDKKMYEEFSKQAGEKGDEQKTGDEQVNEENKDEDGLIDPQWYADNGYDDETVKLAKAMRREQERAQETTKVLEELKQWRSGFEEAMVAQEQARVSQEFHTALDAMDDERFGRAFDESGRVNQLGDNVHEARQRVWEAMAILENGILAQASKKGEVPNIPPVNVLVQRAYQLAFPDAIASQKRQQRVDAAKAQSAKRRPVGTQGATRTKPVNDNDPSSIANHPSIDEWWKKNVKS